MFSAGEIKNCGTGIGNNYNRACHEQNRRELENRELAQGLVNDHHHLTGDAEHVTEFEKPSDLKGKIDDERLAQIRDEYKKDPGGRLLTRCRVVDS